MSIKAVDHSGPLDFFTKDHRDCDELWASVESAVESGDEESARSKWKAFDEAMRHHFAMEEQLLFPAIEAAAGFPPGMGPTAVMRSEHEQMVGLLNQMEQAATGDLRDLLDHGDTLLMIIQQHNLKEEGMLYPMCDQHLREQWGELAAKLDSI